jgi:hypothetical protein
MGLIFELKIYTFRPPFFELSEFVEIDICE